MMRKCTKCGEEKELALFPSKVKKGVVYHKHTCKKCCSHRSTELIKSNPERLEKKRASGRERQKRLRVEDPERLKAIEAKRRASEAHGEWARDYAMKRRPLDIENRIKERVGKTCLIEAVDCVVCNNKSFVRSDNLERKFGRRFCNKCKSKGVSVLGLKLERMVVEKKCIVCAKQYNGRAGGDKRCAECKIVYDRAYKSAYRARRTAKGLRHGKGLRTRARKAGAYMDTVIPKKVYERDKWRCVSCKCKVVVSKSYQPNQASIDHIIPLSMSGSHTYGNVQTMCVACNSSKSNNLTSSVQLTVFDVVRR